jgi:nucleoside-diphosphate-sugar epimerase
VRVFIYTSSSTLYNGIEHSNLTEGYPLAHVVPSAPSQAKAKAYDELMSFDANDLLFLPH